MPGAERSPLILQLAWGRLRVESAEGERTYKDAKLWPGGSRGWDWNETGTQHRPGVQPADVEEIVDRGVAVVVLSKGQSERLEVPQQTLDWLTKRGVKSHVLETSRAVERYNELVRANERVGALIHSTC